MSQTQYSHICAHILLRFGSEPVVIIGPLLNYTNVISMYSIVQIVSRTLCIVL